MFLEHQPVARTVLTCFSPTSQCMASILDPNTFLYALVYKFRLEKWLSSPQNALDKRGEQKDDQLKFLISELEEFLFLLIVIFCKFGRAGQSVSLYLRGGSTVPPVSTSIMPSEKTVSKLLLYSYVLFPSWLVADVA